MTRRVIASGLLVACLSSFLHAIGGRKTFDIHDFSKGLDSYHNPTTLPEGFVQDSLNVLFDDKAPGTKRFGYTTVWSTKSYSYTGLWTYTDPTNTTWQLARSSDQITANNLAGTIVVVATVSANNTVGEANAFGSAYFVDQTQGVYFWNGTSTTYVAGSPKGSIINTFHNRVWVTGAAVPNGNQLYGSAYYSGTNWTTGLNATDPVQYSIGLQDNFDNNTALYVYLDTEYIFKHYAVYALYGFDQTSFQISQLTQECGCIDGNTIQTYNAALEFMSLRGVETFSGYSCKRISDPIKNKVDPAIQFGTFSQQSWLQSSAADWNAGTSFATLTDTYTAPGVVGIQNSLSDGSAIASNWTTNPGLATYVNPTVTLSSASGPTFGYTESYLALPNNWNNQTIYLQFTGRLPKLNGLTKLQLAVADSTTSFAGTHGFGMELFNSDPPLQAFWGFYDTPPSSSAGGNNVVTISNPNDQAFHTLVLISSPTGISTLYIDGISQGTAVFGYPAGGTKFLVITCGMGGSQSDPCEIKNAYVAVSSGSFKSQIHNVGAINSWGNFAVQDVLNNGNIVFSICGSTNSNMSAPVSCAGQTPNAQITISTKTYVQWYATFTVTAATQTPTLQSGTVQWYTGNIAIPMASAVWDNRYWLSLTTNTADASNDAVLVLNSRGAWADFDIHAGAFTQTKGSLYHADSTATGNVYLDNQGYADNGAAIRSYLTTRNESFESLAADDYLYAAYPATLNTGNCAMSVQYNVDSSSMTYSLGSPLLNEFAGATSVKLPFPIDASHQNFGQEINFTFGTNDAVCPWQFFGVTGLYKERPIN